MESSRRAVEAYRRTRLVDGVTGDDDKIAPVYKFDEISSVLRSSSHEIVRELTDYIFKRLDHKSPLVKQKTLRLIKFIVGKSGNEFKREVQRQSAAIRQLFHYQGQPDPLRGDSLNKAVRDTARETITSVFSAEEKPPVEQATAKRIEGFGSNNFDSARPMQEKKTLLSEVVDLGAASIKQGLSMISNHYSNMSSGNNLSKGFGGGGGSYQAPDLRTDRESYRESYRDRESYREPVSFSVESNSEPGSPVSEAVEEEQGSGEDEEKLLDSFTLAGGVRLQPPREAVQAFLLAAQKMNPGKLHECFESKLQVHSWQVRFKALCFLEAILRQRSVRTFGDVALRFGENTSRVVECTESPQNTLRDKAKKVLTMLQDEQEQGERAIKKKVEHIEMPDLLDTSSNGIHELEAPAVSSSLEDLLLGVENPHSQAAPVDSFTASDNPPEDPFAGMAIHNTQHSTATTTTTTSSSTRTTTSNSFLDDGGASGLFEGLSVSGETEAGKQAGASSILDWQQLVAPGDSSTSKHQQQLLGEDSALKSLSFSSAPQGIQVNQWQAQQQQQRMLFMNPVMFPGGALNSGLFQQQQMFQGLNPVQQHQQQQGRVSAGALDSFDFSSNPYSAASSIGIPKMEETTKAFDFITDHVTAARIIKK